MSDTERDKFLEQLYELYFDRLVRFCRWYLRAYPDLYYMVGVAGFEPATFCSRSKRATKLRYTPKKWSQ